MDGSNLSLSPEPESTNTSTVEETVVRQTTPAKHSRKLWLLLVLPFALAVAIFVCNYIFVDADAHSVTSVPGNEVVSASAHYEDWIKPTTIVFDLEGYSSASKLDVFRVLLQFADRQKGHLYSEVILSRAGERRFIIPGSYFQTLGQEYATQNPMYTIRTFPTHLSTPSGTNPFLEYEGGILGVLSKEMEQFNDMMSQWME